ncbi:DUF262 domain-containing protein [Pseudomonas aeruginosa]|uniref:DUF262 domain-containing protein n=1 Tax=Pseudomonas aeruginosa TaxID=287 RepID=UPI0009A937D1|nr:DUF262 domain-containing protein [Pseudomonas aeruginosa]MBH4083474.1 DUF262 domain-containing protein [Pseudomonas aeruginosa]MBP8438700.1 DUF262 domain-containing protein [Pseudomonas aeruginosa]MBP8444485.1 DUF262 domain-containing protein [Pseudomonas aeruginosa]MBP8468608.1 DUF262 domain-containing protein [Pseudomonas aeruginosa]MBP8482478.1 DUF262 domain-containing protein [Pseudomonas aeruginosa]
MKIKQHTWPISELVGLQESINLNPVWQRGAAWKAPRKSLLIDSILRSMDIPKIYLRKLPANGAHHYDAVDGQQRIRAIWEFRSGEFALEHPDVLPPIDGHVVQGKNFNQLPKILKDKFDFFEVSVAEIVSATNDEITNLFARLQLGVALNPAELRNAMLGPVRHMIDSIATGHVFFSASRIPDTRYKRQDYVGHVFAMAAYDGQKNIKAPDLKKMVAEFGVDRAAEVLSISSRVNDALTVLAEVDEYLGHRLTQKWLFVDLAWLIMQEQAAGIDVDAEELANNFREFELLRRQYTRQPESLLQATKQPRTNKLLYDYIMAFRAQGATHANLKVRNVSLRAFCL